LVETIRFTPDFIQNVKLQDVKQ